MDNIFECSYDNSNKTCVICGLKTGEDLSSTKGVLTIPDTINGFKVVSIQKEAFADVECIKHLVIDGDTLSFGTGCFKSSGLQTLKATKLKHIRDGYGIFSYCPLEEIDLSSLEILEGEMVFEGVTGSNVTFKLNKLQKLRGNDNFNGIVGLDEIDLSSLTDLVGEGNFSYCTNLRSVNLSNVERLVIENFDDCDSLEEILLPKYFNKNENSKEDILSFYNL